MKPTVTSQSSFAIMALCFCQSCIIIGTSTTTYIHCNEHLVEGNARALEGDWKQAARIWNQLANSGTGSACGKAAYNMVVACEMLNRRDMAIQWAHKTIMEYKSSIAKRRAQHYLHLLNEAGIVVEVVEVAARDER